MYILKNRVDFAIIIFLKKSIQLSGARWLGLFLQALSSGL